MLGQRRRRCPDIKTTLVKFIVFARIECAMYFRGPGAVACVERRRSWAHHPEKVTLAQFSLYEHKSGLKHYSINLIFISSSVNHKVI